MFDKRAHNWRCKEDKSCLKATGRKACRCWCHPFANEANGVPK